MPHHAFQVAIGVQAVLAQDDPRESTGRIGGAVDRQAPPAKIRHGLHIGVAEKPEQRMVGAEADRYPTDPVGQPRHQRSAQADHRAAAQTFRRPADPVADGDVDTLILEVALLVGDMGDQLLVDTTPDVGQIDRLHSTLVYRPLSVHGKAAIDLHAMAGDETGILTRQERHRLGDLVGTDEAPHGIGRAELTHLLRVQQRVRRCVGHRGGRNEVSGDPVRRQLECDVPDELIHCRLGGAHRDHAVAGAGGTTPW